MKTIGNIAARYAAILFMILPNGMGRASAQDNFATAPSTTETKTVFLELDVKSKTLGSTDLVDLATDGSGKVYARLYVATDEAGTAAADQSQLSFTFDSSIADLWVEKEGITGYVFIGTGFTADMLNKISVSLPDDTQELTLNNYYVALQVSKGLTNIYYSKLVNKQWRFAKELPSHLAYGPGGDGTVYYHPEGGSVATAAASGKIYDDRISFTVESITGGKFIHDTGADKTISAHKSVDGYTESTSKYSADDAERGGFDISFEDQTLESTWSLETDEGGNVYLVLADNTYFPFVCSNGQYSKPRFIIESITDNIMVLYYDATWRWRYVFIADGISPTNLLESATVGEVWSFYNPGWKGGIGGATGFERNTNTSYTATFNRQEYTGTWDNGDAWKTEAGIGDWQMQFNVPTNINTSADKYYNLSFLIGATYYVDEGQVSLQQTVDGNATKMKEYRMQTLNINGAEPIYRVVNIHDIKGRDLQNIDILFDFTQIRPQYTEEEIDGVKKVTKVVLPATTIYIKDIVLAEATTCENNLTVTKEPSDMARYVLKEQTFKAETVTTTVEETFEQKVEDWNAGSREFTVAFDIADSKIKLLNSGNTEVGSIDMSADDRAFWGSNPDNFYVRWFWQNRETGEETYIASSIGTATGGEAYMNAYKWVNSVFWSSKNEASGARTRAVSADLSKVMRIRIDGTPEDGSAFHLYDYDLVCTIGTTGGEELDAATKRVTKEATTLQRKYVFHLNTSDDFEADNLNATGATAPKVIYKDVYYDEASHTVSPRLLADWRQIIADLGSTRNEFRDVGYARWYLIDKTKSVDEQVVTGGSYDFWDHVGGGNGDPSGPIKIGGVDAAAADYNADYTAATNTKHGYFRYQFHHFMNTYNPSPAEGDTDLDFPKASEFELPNYDPVITIPAEYQTGTAYKNLQVVCVVTRKTDDMDLPNCEPREIEAKYIFDLWTIDDYAAQGFVHSQGASKRPWKAYGSSFSQSLWDYDSNEKVENQNVNYRQDVHTVEYNIYVNEGVGELVHLNLPFQDYIQEDGEGNNTEPMSYVRWYDWDLDKLSDDYDLVKVNHSTRTESSSLDDYGYGRGLFAFKIEPFWREDTGWKFEKPARRDRIGVQFKVPTGFSDRTTPFNVACDISRYDDGIAAYPQLTRTARAGKHGYLIHEPTLGVRYLFHIWPAKVLADGIAAENSAVKEEGKGQKLADIEAKLKNGTAVSAVEKQNMFKLYEDNGHVAVSLNDGVGSFSLRMNLESPSSYYIGSTPTQAEKLQWYIYYEDASGIWKKKMTMDTHRLVQPNPNGDEHKDGDPDVTSDAWIKKYYKYSDLTTSRIGIYTLDDFTTTDGVKYTLLAKGEEQTKEMTVDEVKNRKFNLVGVLSNADESVSAPVIHYELQFINAAPLTLTQLQGVQERQEDYLQAKLMPNQKERNELTFDDLFKLEGDTNTNYDPPTNSQENYASIPLSWGDAQYGFAYPQLYAQNGTNYQLSHYDGWQGWGISPLHGDYTILKSMNRVGVSQNEVSGNEDNQTFHNIWFRPDDELYDVTYSKGGSQYGSFLYVDAADESRTIATLHFDAKGMCAGSEFYYTAYVADMTTGTGVPPQVLFRVSAYNDEGVKVPIVAFHTGDLNTELLNGELTPDGADPRGQWYQVYGHATIPVDVDMNRIRMNTDGSKSFIVEIDNYSISTAGADYCVDQITFFTCAAQMQVLQSDAYCVDDKVKVSIYMDAENLQSTALGISDEAKKIYYRICRASDDKELSEAAGVTPASLYNNGDKPYGVASVVTNYSTSGVASSLATLVDSDSKPVSGFYYGTDGRVYFRLAYGEYPLESGEDYYVSVYTLGDYDPADNNTGPIWGSPTESCTVYSSAFKAHKIYVTLTDDGGDELLDIMADCSGYTMLHLNAKMKLPDTTVSSGYATVSDLHYDYFIGAAGQTASEVMAAYKTAHYDDRLTDALASYRQIVTSTDKTLDEAAYQAAIDAEGDAATKTLMQGYLATLRKYYKAGQLMFCYSSVFNYELLEPDTYSFVAIPAEKYLNTATMEVYMEPLESTDANYDSQQSICFPIPFSVKYSITHPVLELGFDDVTYPNKEGYSRRIVRIGREQLKNLRESGYSLHIPVHSYADKAGKTQADTDTKLTVVSDLRLFRTNDPSYTRGDDDVITGTQPVIATFNEKEINGSNKKFLSLKFDGAGMTESTFHEGYEYYVSFMFKDPVDVSDDTKCSTDMQFILKVVPEYVTWLADNQTNRNWNNDENWKRSTKAELHKDVAGQNTDSYEDATEQTGLESATQPASYTPMRFTKVTLPQPTETVKPLAPNLANLAAAGNIISTSAPNGKNGLYQSTLSADDLSEATKFIEYDMLVRWGIYDGEVAGNVCKDHSITGDVYDCEKFRGNVCNQIYFKPEAELINQQYLIYNKAWVEKELTANQWYLMSAPLQDTYAGDMYVPYVDGKQTTEAFEDINFGADYSRTKYPIYQRSWGKSATVYVSTDDGRRSDFSADIAITTDNAASIGMDWGHTYNDVTVPYNTWQGFSIRAHRKAGTDALLRLPKADDSYEYFDYSDTATNPKSGATVKAVNKEKPGRLVADMNDNAEQVTVSVDDAQQVNGFVLVGNPYMASVSMDKFFDGNNVDTDKRYYWVFEDGELTALKETGTLRPMEAFFIKTDQDLVFNPSMLIDGNTSPEMATPATANTRQHETGIRDAEVAEGIVVITVDERTVTVAASEMLRQVRVLTMGGVTVGDLQPSASETSFMLPAGFYLIEAWTDGGGHRTVKIVVK